MDLKSHSCFPGTTYRRAHLFKGHGSFSEIECVGARTSEAHGRGYATMATAGRVIGDETTVGPGKCQDFATRAFESLGRSPLPHSGDAGASGAEQEAASRRGQWSRAVVRTRDWAR
jgi:hypothetical protein